MINLLREESLELLKAELKKNRLTCRDMTFDRNSLQIKFTNKMPAERAAAVVREHVENLTDVMITQVPSMKVWVVEAWVLNVRGEMAQLNLSKQSVSARSYLKSAQTPSKKVPSPQLS